MMHSDNSGGNGQNITARTNTMAAVTLPSLPSEGTPTACAGTYITDGWYARSVLMFSSSQPDGMPVRRRLVHHHQWMVCRAGVDVLVITTRWYAGPMLMFSSSQPDGTLIQCR